MTDALFSSCMTQQQNTYLQYARVDLTTACGVQNTLDNVSITHNTHKQMLSEVRESSPTLTSQFPSRKKKRRENLNTTRTNSHVSSPWRAISNPDRFQAIVIKCTHLSYYHLLLLFNRFLFQVILARTAKHCFVPRQAKFSRTNNQPPRTMRTRFSITVLRLQCALICHSQY